LLGSQTTRVTTWKKQSVRYTMLTQHIVDAFPGMTGYMLSNAYIFRAAAMEGIHLRSTSKKSFYLLI
jgi:hypothetical protein